MGYNKVDGRRVRRVLGQEPIVDDDNGEEEEEEDDEGEDPHSPPLSEIPFLATPSTVGPSAQAVTSLGSP